MTNLVMGLARGYTVDQLRPFIASLRATGYKGHVCLFHEDLGDGAIEMLRKYDVELVPFALGRLNIGFKSGEAYSALNRIYLSPLGRVLPLNRVFASLVNLISGGDYARKSHILAKITNIYCVRYPLYYLYLSEHGSRFKNVMMTDVRDVIFQRDPFDFDINGAVCCFLEEDRWPINRCGTNSHWIVAAYGRRMLQEVGGQRISCGGITIGPANPLMRYLEAMIDQILLLKVQTGGIDQAVHHSVLYKQRLPGVRLIENGSGPVMTMSSTSDLPQKFNGEGWLLNYDGAIASVLHQYDRHIGVGRAVLEERGDEFRLRPI